MRKYNFSERNAVGRAPCRLTARTPLSRNFRGKFTASRSNSSRTNELRCPSGRDAAAAAASGFIYIRPTVKPGCFSCAVVVR